MFGKWRYVGGALVLALGVAVLPLHAQRGKGPRGQGIRGQGGPNIGQSLDLALENREALGLTQDQVGQLEELKAIMERDVLGLAEEMKTLRDSIRAGDLDRNDGFRQLEALRGEFITASAPLRGRVQEILTVEQHNQLRSSVRQNGLGMGRGGAVPGRGAPSVQLRGRRMGMGMGMGMRGGTGRGARAVPSIRRGPWGDLTSGLPEGWNLS
jgi:hypothetical protein